MPHKTWVQACERLKAGDRVTFDHSARGELVGTVIGLSGYTGNGGEPCWSIDVDETGAVSHVVGASRITSILRAGSTWSAAARVPPVWAPCECGEFACTIHLTHAFDCPCPPVEEWDVDPYAAAPVAALYVQTNGCYFGLPGVDPWDVRRDARKYAGPFPVVAHPPCDRWCRYAPQVEQRYQTKAQPDLFERPHRVGEDGGSFEHALASVRAFGGVLEHPVASLAWSAHGLAAPPPSGGWVDAGDGVGRVCRVEQGHYGHRARKPTWLYAVSDELPELQWGESEPKIVARRPRMGAVQYMSKRERAATPKEFRDLLLSIARSAANRREVQALSEHVEDGK